jgi:hypothetical protein
MKKLRSAFKDAFGVPIEQILPLEKNLIPIEGNFDNSVLFGSKSAAENPYLLDPSFDEFIDSTPMGYFLVGFWGYGANSYAFYYSIVDSWKRVSFRLPYGGVYSDNKKRANDIINFFPKYFDFQEKLSGKVKKLIAMESMGVGYYKVELLDGGTFEACESLLRNPDFKNKFDRII